MENDEANNPSIDICQSNTFRCSLLHVEQCVAEGRSDEGHLKVHRDDDDKPYNVETEQIRDGQINRESDKDDPDPVNEEAHNEDKEHHDQYRPLAIILEAKDKIRTTTSAPILISSRKDCGADHGCHNHGICLTEEIKISFRAA